MRAAFLALLLASSVLAGDTIEALGQHWIVQMASDWSVAGDQLKLVVPGEPPPGLPRRPQKFAIAATEPFRRVTVEAEVRRNQGSLIMVYAWQDESHFDYAHLSVDAAVNQVAHNGMFHVFGGERVRISPLDGSPALATQEWTPVKLVFDGDSGRCYVEVNGKSNPSLDAFDLSLRHGRVGFGSFDETGDFRKVRISGESRSGAIVGHR
jgi:hypothetical protein